MVFHFNTDIEAGTDQISWFENLVLALNFFVDIGGSLDEFIEWASTVFLGLFIFSNEHEIWKFGIDEFGDFKLESVFSNKLSGAHFIIAVIGAIEFKVEFG